MDASGLADQEIVLFPVEKRFLQLVTETVAEAYKAKDDEMLPVREWGVEDLTRLDEMLPHPHIARAILDLGSSEGYVGVEIVLANVVNATGQLKAEKARAQLSGLTKRVKSEFARRNWPFTFNWQDGKASYTVSAEVAEKWRAVTKKAK